MSEKIRVRVCKEGYCWGAYLTEEQIAYSEAQGHTVTIIGEEEPVYYLEEGAPKACIIATVFLGQQHPLLAPMRKFRDLFIPRVVMDIYYCVSVYVLRKIGRLR